MYSVRSVTVLAVCLVITSPSSFGQIWDIARGIDPISDSANVQAAMSSTSGFEGLVVRCEQQVLNIYITWGMGAAGYFDAPTFLTEVTTRFDQETPVTRTWGVSTDYSSTFSPEPKSFIQSLATHDRLVARAISFAGIETAIFDLTLAGQVVEEVLEVCGNA